LPGVRNASYATPVLLSSSANTSDIRVPGGSPKTPKDVSIVTIGPSYFDAMQIPILLGRDLDERDLDSHHVVINELFAQSAFGSDNPVGRHFSLGRGAGGTDLEIVGVTKNVYYSSLKDEIPPTVYKPCCEGVRWINFAIRTAGDPMAMAASARSLLHDADSRIPMTDVTTQEHVTEQGIGQERTFATLCTAFALLAIVIAGVGLYGTMAYSVARRTGEIGIRMALGAQRTRVVWMVEREVLILAAVGFAIGLPIAYKAATLVEAFLFGVKAHDVATLLVTPGILLLCAVLAGFGPARRASKIDPVTALRED
jgi:predicted permease